MSGIDDRDEWPQEDVLLQARPMIAIRRVDQTHVAIRERAWPDGDAEVVLLVEDLPRLIERLGRLHAEWAGHQGNGEGGPPREPNSRSEHGEP